MPHLVTIFPSKHSFMIGDNESILEAALREGYILPYGCRDGACGSCKGKILAGNVNYGNYQENALSGSEKSSGLALFCQAKALSDLKIECRDMNAIKGIQIKTFPVRVQTLTLLAPDVMGISLRLPANERLVFLAGQYIDVLLKDGRKRSLSLANAPHDDTLLQFHMRRVNNGHFSHHVFNEMKERDILRIRGPLGTFFIREDSDKPVIFVAGGTGFAPVKSIIEYAFNTGLRRQFVLFWGARSKTDLYLSSLVEEWQRTQQNFKYVPVLSEPKISDQWQGRTGLVHKTVMDSFATLSGHQVYVCGTPAMVEAARRDFIQDRALDAENLFSDSFVFSHDTLCTG